MTDEEKWKRRFLNAVVAITERDEKIEQLQREIERLKEEWDESEKSQSSWGEFQRQGKMLEKAQAEVERLTALVAHYNAGNEAARECREQ